MFSYRKNNCFLETMACGIYNFIEQIFTAELTNVQLMEMVASVYCIVFSFNAKFIIGRMQLFTYNMTQD